MNEKAVKKYRKKPIVMYPKDYGELIAQSWLERRKRKIIMPELQEVEQ